MASIRLEAYDALGISACSSQIQRRQAYEIVNEQLQSLLQQIDGSQSEIRQWKIRHNSLSVVFKLPEEIIAKILTILVAKSLGCDSPSMQWIVATHVCSRWRNIALGCKKLWSRPYFRKLDCATEMLKRSGNHSLFIDATVTYLRDGVVKLNSTLCELIGENIHLTKILKLDDVYLADHPTDPSQRLLLDVVQRPAPRLEFLVLSAPKNTNKILPLPGNLFSGDCINLRHLSLHRLHLPSTPESFRSFAQLEHLSIELSFLTQSSFDSLSDIFPSNTGIIASIQSLPNLKRLTLVNAFDPRQNNQALQFQSESHSKPAVAFAQLKDITIFDRSFNILLLLDSISSQKMQCLRIVSLDEKMFKLGLHQLVQAIGGVLKTSTLVDALELLCETNDSRNGFVLGFRQPISPGLSLSAIHPNPGGPILVDAWKIRPIMLDLWQYLMELEEAENILQQILPLKSFKTIYYYLHMSSHKIWCRLSQLTHLYSLAVRYNHPSFLSAFPGSQGGGETAVQNAFPDLRNLVLYNWTFGEEEDDDSDLMELSLVEELLKSWSGESTAKKIHVIFYKCRGVTEAAISRLNAINPPNHVFLNDLVSETIPSELL